MLRPCFLLTAMSSFCASCPTIQCRCLWGDKVESMCESCAVETRRRPSPVRESVLPIVCWLSGWSDAVVACALVIRQRVESFAAPSDLVSISHRCIDHKSCQMALDLVASLLAGR